MLEQRIKEKFEDLSPGHKLIAEKILYQPEKYTMLSISNCSEKLGVSNSSLSRFVRELDFESYSEFQLLLKSQLMDQFSPKTKMKQTLGKKGTIENRLQSEIMKDIESMSFALQTIDVEKFKEAVDLLVDAETIYIVGLGVSRSVVIFLEFRLRRMGVKQKALTVGGYEMLEHLTSMDSKDALIAISFQRSYDEVISAVMYAKEKQVPTLTITENRMSPIALNADVLVTLKRGPHDQLNSLAVPISICNALMLELNHYRQEQAMQNMENLEFLSKIYQTNLKENNND